MGAVMMMRRKETDIRGLEEEYASDLSENDCCSRIISDSYSRYSRFIVD